MDQVAPRGMRAASVNQFEIGVLGIVKTIVRERELEQRSQCHETFTNLSSSEPCSFGLRRPRRIQRRMDPR